MPAAESLLSMTGWASSPFLAANHVASALVSFDRSQIYNGIKIRFFLLSYLSLLCFWLEGEGGGKGKKI